MKIQILKYFNSLRNLHKTRVHEDDRITLFYIEQETQTETQSGLKSQEQIETESEHSFYEGPFYLMFGPQKQLLLVSANEIKQNSQNFHGIQINPKQDELQKQGKKTYKLSQKQPKMIDYLVKRNTNYSNTNQQMPPKSYIIN
ncbi:hypothetical protein pb186bvf_016428 [Paramecium bursaria]